MRFQTFNTGCTLLVWGLIVNTLAMSGAAQATGQDQPPFDVRVVAQGLQVPWGMVFVNQHELLVTERAGAVKRVNIRTGAIRQVSGVPPVWAEGQGGLLDVARPPDEHAREWFYFTYSKPVNGQGATTLARAKLDGNRLVQWEDLLVTQSRSDTSRHFGSRIAFDGRGHVFFSVGDRGVRDSAQDLSSHNGSIIRLNLDGSVPRDNPFVGQPGARPEIWSYGHRNPQGLAWDATRNLLWEIEHGPRGGDEINRVLPGRNYGWPIISYGKEYWAPIRVGEGTHKAGMEQPVHYYVPSIAPGSLMLYSGTRFPQWKGDLFAGALAQTHLNHVDLDAHGQVVAEYRWLTDLGERMRAVTESPEGDLLISTDSGRILQLSLPGAGASEMRSP
ncbi:MAG: PQQ-dependent sugar dehydrogenase [Gammaproteobacteria bacterium]|nr:MAG: PQQ-dependent sugar dehydrogenase [Gammaproteobacteria bacterium]